MSILRSGRTGDIGTLARQGPGDSRRPHPKSSALQRPASIAAMSHRYVCPSVGTIGRPLSQRLPTGSRCARGFHASARSLEDQPGAAAPRVQSLTDAMTGTDASWAKMIWQHANGWCLQPRANLVVRAISTPRTRSETSPSTARPPPALFPAALSSQDDLSPAQMEHKSSCPGRLEQLAPLAPWPAPRAPYA